MDKFRLIAEIHNRPMLWNNEVKRKSKMRDIADNWSEVARNFGDDVTVADCQNTFKYLQSSYRKCKTNKRSRIDRDMRNGEYDPKKNYDSNWLYYEAMQLFDKDPIKLPQCLNHVKNQTEREKDQKIIISSLNHNISSHSSETDTMCYKINFTDNSDEEQVSTPQQKPSDPTNRTEQRKVPYNKQYHNTKRQSRLSINSTTPEQKLSDATNEEHIHTSHSSTTESCYYQIHLIEDTDDESIILNADIKEEPLDIEADSYPLAVEESQENQSLKSQDLDESSTRKPQTNVKELTKNNQISKTVNRPKSTDKPCSKDKITLPLHNQFPNVDIKEEPLFEIEADSYHSAAEENEFQGNEVKQNENSYIKEEPEEECEVNLPKTQILDKSSTLKQNNDKTNQLPNACIKEEPALDIEADLNHMEEEEIQENEFQSLALNENSALKRKRLISSSSKTDENLSRPLKRQNIDPFPNADIKEEPPLDIEADSYPNTEENSQSLDKTSTLKPHEVESLKHHNLCKNVTLKQKSQISSSSKNIPLKVNNVELCWSSIQDVDDSDLNFLASFLSHMKSLTPLQNLQFRAKMSNLILSFLTSTCSGKEFTTPECNTNKLPMDISDPDCNFLISFWPYIKSLTQLQNLQYRSKMSNLMIDILSKDGIESNDNLN